ncbi:hypothetical protein [Streptomyces flavofungini]|uniref:Uncharacterized protein n=1 Tax=Streptomyces flavofungini TaxID=68200 RepID=A0ABS0X5P5_9ACTN|nr:hypothetical protein [Streptomyces flavofungini]MBJ3808525.1 hypothetical protein [Streptomyces flavofungini]GHC70069.1 hypothetical protein GCM10010349_45430 [Streptomyces flavofungini]
MAVLGQGGAGQGIPGQYLRGRVAPRDAPALQWIGAAVLLYALTATIWITYEAQDAVDNSLSRFTFKALYDPRQFLTPVAQTHYDWGFLVAAVVVGALALGRRRVARGGLALLATLLICLGLRELIGLMASDEYGDLITEIGYGKALLTFRFTGVALGCAMWAVVARTHGSADGAPAAPAYPAHPPQSPYADAPPPPAYAPHGDLHNPRPGTDRHRPAFVAAGIALLLSGAIEVSWLIYTLTQDEVYFIGSMPGADAGDFFRAAVDASRGLPLPQPFYTLALVVAPLLVGLLLLAGRTGARGAALTLALVSTYFDIRTLVPAFDDGFDLYWDTTVGTLLILTPFATIPLQAVVVIAMLRAAQDRSPTGAYGGQPWPGQPWPRDSNRHR